MVELTETEVERMKTIEIIARLRVAADYQKNHKAITWEHGNDLVNIVAIHGHKIADLMEASLPEAAFD